MPKITPTNTKEINQLGKDVGVILERITNIKQQIDDIKKTLECSDEKYTSKIEFALTNKEQDNRIAKIEKLVFSAVGLALITLGKAVLDLVVQTKAQW